MAQTLIIPRWGSVSDSPFQGAAYSTCSQPAPMGSTGNQGFAPLPTLYPVTPREASLHARAPIHVTLLQARHRGCDSPYPHPPHTHTLVQKALA